MPNKIVENTLLGNVMNLLQENSDARYAYRASNPFRRLYYVAPEKVSNTEDWQTLGSTHKLPQALLTSLDDHTEVTLTGYYITVTPGYVERECRLTPEDSSAVDWVVMETQNE
jgi:hypothetical protein